MTSERMGAFWGRVDKAGDCWLWTGALNSKGYGRFREDGSLKAAHRIAYELTIGPIPEGLVIDHLCRVHGCVNPDHLEPVTNRENLLRGEGVTAAAAQATHCPSGHPYEGGNLYVWRGTRQCRKCRQISSRKRQHRRVECPHCGGDFAYGSIATHRRRKHGTP